MMMIVLFVALAFTNVFAFSDDFINEINSKQNQWRAGRNFPENMTLSELRSLLGLKTMPQEVFEKIPIKYHEVNAGDLPESFDARIQWPNCKSIKEVVDQSACGSCWAVSVASAISDRICIHSNGTLQTQISSRNILACDDSLSGGCHGGFSYYAWVYWKNKGIVTGGPYGSKLGCQPYSFAPCEHNINGSKPPCPTKHYDTPDCVKSCDNPSLSYTDDLVHGSKAYRLIRKDEQIRAEIYNNGPVVGGLTVFTDLFQYKSGVYTRTSGSEVGGHAVRIIGWGEEKGTKYWLVANSWNEDWGDKGLFKIRRGTNECGIEDQINAGLP